MTRQPVPYQRGLVEVADGVFAWLQPDGSWGWSNAGLITADDHALLVDTLFDLRLTGEMLDAMRAAIPAAAHIETVVNTHANGDHCYGNRLVQDAEIIASSAAAAEMERVPPSVLAALLANAPAMGAAGRYAQDIFGVFHFEEIEPVLPSRTFDGTLDLTVGDTRVRLLELGPAHTEGDVIAHLPDRGVVFTGDLLFVGGHPIVWTGPIANWVAALDRILALEPDVVVPGHGPVTDVRAVADVRAYFIELEAAARPLWEEGVSALDAARRIRLDRAAGWGDAERLVVNVNACYRGFGDTGEAANAFADMAALAGYTDP